MNIIELAKQAGLKHQKKRKNRMNERIKELAEQAYALCGKHTNNYDGPAFAEKFAELVSAHEREECAKWLDFYDGPNGRRAEAIRARGTI